jgi:acyl carrier protein phosphodiesterase
MNYLGHLYFSGNDLQLMYANLFGDFVKGSDLSNYPPVLRKGIQLHRKIDSYIDHHPKVNELMHELYPFLPKVTGIAIDLIFDHLLASNWSKFHPLPYRQFLDQFYELEISQRDGYTEEFHIFTLQLKRNDWMIHYASREGLQKMCTGVGSKLSFPNALHSAPELFDAHRERMEGTFQLFMQDAIPHFENLRLEPNGL